MTSDWIGSVKVWHRVMAAVAVMMTASLGEPAAAMTIEQVTIDDKRAVVRFDNAVSQSLAMVLDRLRLIAPDAGGATPGHDPASDRAAGGGIDARQRDGNTLFGFTDVDTERFARASQRSPLRLLGIGQAEPKYHIVVPVPPVRRGSGLPKVRGEDGLPLVVIDAGHGGHDPGAINPDTGLREKDVTLRIAQAIRDELLDSGRVRVALTRTDDRYLLHRERFGVARRLHADLFISIHCDSVAPGIGNSGATGASVYTLSEIASDKEAALLAARENKADVISGVRLDRNTDVSSILIDLTQRETMNASAGYARLLAREAKSLIPTKSAFHRMASLLVLKAPDMPSVLFETGYISNPADAAFLDSREGRSRIARSVQRSVEAYFARRMATR